MSESLKDIFEKTHQKKVAENNPSMTPEEAERFRKAFDDPEFRKLFAEYTDELQDPANRAETEAYIKQLEEDNKVPEGKELVR